MKMERALKALVEEQNYTVVSKTDFVLAAQILKNGWADYSFNEDEIWLTPTPKGIRYALTLGIKYDPDYQSKQMDRWLKLHDELYSKNE